MTRQTSKRALTGVVLAGTIVLGSITGAGIPALAVTPGKAGTTARTAPAAGNATVDEIPAGKTGSLTVHRGIAGVTVKATRVLGVDLRTAEGRRKAAEYQRNLSAARSQLGESVTSEPTGADGTATISNLDVGLYLVTEVTSGSGRNPADDVLVSVPLFNESTGTWDYSVDVFPKSSESVLTKSVADGNLGIEGQDAPVAGYALTYVLEGGISNHGLRGFGGRCERNGTVDTGTGRDASGFDANGSCAEGATYVGVSAGAAYEIIDDLTTSTVPGSSPVRRASDYLESRGGTWAGKVTVAITGAGAAGSLLQACTDGAEASCDYQLQHSATRVAVSMTDQGLLALDKARIADRNARVQVTIQARVKPGGTGTAPVVAATSQSQAQLNRSVPAGVLDLPNKAVLYSTGSAKRSDKPAASNTVVTRFGTLKLHKIDSRTGASLSGAQFTLYRTRDDATRGKHPLAVSASTNAAGMTQFAGLHVNDFQNDMAGVTDSYWVVETKTPKGYVSAARAIEVRLLMDGSTQAADATLGMPVKNTAGSGPQAPPPSGDNPPAITLPRLPDRLPFTGFELATAAAIAASLLGGGWLFLALSRRRRKDDEEQEGPDGTPATAQG